MNIIIDKYNNDNWIEWLTFFGNDPNANAMNNNTNIIELYIINVDVAVDINNNITIIIINIII